MTQQIGVLGNFPPPPTIFSVFYPLHTLAFLQCGKLDADVRKLCTIVYRSVREMDKDPEKLLFTLWESYIGRPLETV
jgi:hypothetical protein